eukprot:XP_001199790.2 PREDICTED: beta-4C adrenergic receptor-like [Strongylocentrotus purpuratus]
MTGHLLLTTNVKEMIKDMDLYNTTELATEEAVTIMTTAMANQGAIQVQQFTVIMTVATSLICSILSIVLNTLNIMVACSDQLNFPISNSVAIVSMSLGDIIIGLSTIMRFSLGSWARLICRVHLILSVTGVRVSIVSLILIIVDRYVAIVHPFAHRRFATKRFCIVLVIVMWALTTFANVLENATGTYFYDPNRRLCDVQVSITRVVVSTTLLYFIPLTTMLVIYTHLLVVVRRMVREIARVQPIRDYSISIHDQGVYPCSDVSLPSDPGPRPRIEIQERPNAHALRQNDHTGQYKLILTFFAVTAAFTVTTIPNRIVRLVALYKGPQAVSSGATLFCRMLVISGSWLNFVIFSVMNHNFRRTLKHILRRRCSAHCC